MGKERGEGGGGKTRREWGGGWMMACVPGGVLI